MNPCKSANETFGPLNSNSSGNPYIDPGKYQLRTDNSSERSYSTIDHKSPFKNMHGNKIVKKSEFDYLPTNDLKGANTLRSFVDRSDALYNRKTAEPFTQFSEIGYAVDPYERKQDLLKAEYARLNNKILKRNEPFTSHVRQHGTFYPNFLTFGTDK